MVRKKHKRYKSPLNKSVIFSTFLFSGLLCVVLTINSTIIFGRMLTSRYDTYIDDLLVYTASNIDVDDLAECIDTGARSEKYEQLQMLLDNIKKSYTIDYIYIVKPLSISGTNNVMDVITGILKMLRLNILRHSDKIIYIILEMQVNLVKNIQAHIR